MPETADFEADDLVRHLWILKLIVNDPSISVNDYVLPFPMLHRNLHVVIPVWYGIVYDCVTSLNTLGTDFLVNRGVRRVLIGLDNFFGIPAGYAKKISYLDTVVFECILGNVGTKVCKFCKSNDKTSVTVHHNDPIRTS